MKEINLSIPYNVELQSMPSLFALYRKIFFGHKPGWDNKELPKIQVSLNKVALSAAKIRQYAEVCGYEFDGRVLPPTYLHVIMFRLHAEIFTQDAVTFPLLGMIHLKNTIHHLRPVGIEEELNVACQLISSELTETGLEFVLESKAFAGDELVWQSSSTYLYRVEGGKRARPPRAKGIDWSEAEPVSLEANLGWHYAKASGDFNLIHLHPMLSKRFGFDKVLAHGMWSKAHCIARLMPKVEKPNFKMEVEFKLPIFMPSEISFNAEVVEDSISFELRDRKGKRPHVVGKLLF